MIDRKKLEQNAFEIARSDMMNINATDEEIKTEISKCSNATLIIYIAENGDDEQ